jgi:hypothetical protein
LNPPNEKKNLNEIPFYVFLCSEMTAVKKKYIALDSALNADGVEIKIISPKTLP